MWRKIIALSALAFIVLAAAACEREGPAEKAGKDMDRFMKGVGEKLSK